MQPFVHTIPLHLALLMVCAVMFMFFNLFSAVLLWHWRMYSTGKFTTLAHMSIYLGVGFTLIGIMVFVALTFTVS